MLETLKVPVQTETNLTEVTVGNRRVRLFPIADPILRRNLGSFPDWREYDLMSRDPTIADALQHLEVQIERLGFEVEIGSSRSEAAKQLQAFGEAAIASIGDAQMAQAVRYIGEARDHGWKPIQIVSDTRARWRGRNVWMPNRLIDMPAYQFRVGVNGELVHFRTDGKVRLYTPEEVRVGWCLPSWGTQSSPYGKGDFGRAWLIWTALRMVRERSMSSLDREAGMLKVTRKGTDSAGNIPWQDLTADIANLLELYNGSNVAVEVGPYAVEVVSGLSFIGSMQAAMDSLKTDLRTLLTGETLTSDPGDRGTYALGQVHERVRTDYALSRALVVELVLTEAIRVSCTLNFGEIDPEDLPTVRSRIRTQVAPETIRQLYELGAPINVSQVVERLGGGYPSLLPPSEQDFVVTKPATPSPADFLGVFGGGSSASDSVEPAPEVPPELALAHRGLVDRVQADRGLGALEALARAQADQLGALNEHLDEVTRDALRDAAPVLRDYVRSFLESYRQQREQAADPLASGPLPDGCGPAIESAQTGLTPWHEQPLIR